jgi:hypothetical protein
MTGFAHESLGTFQSIPKELWTPIGMLAAGLLSAGIAFIGVLIQNISASCRHRRELEHDGTERKLEREGELKKLVYLDAVQELTALSTKIVATAATGQEANEKEKEKEELSNSLGKINRLYAIANIETVRAVERATRTLMHAAVKIARAKMAILIFENKVNEFEKVFNIAVEQCDIRAKKLASPDALSDEEKKTISAELERFQGTVKEVGEDLIKFKSKVAQRKVDLFSLSTKSSQEAVPHVWQAVIEIRRELGFPIDQENLLAVASESSDELLKASEEFLAEVKEKMDPVHLIKPTSAV